MIDLVPRRVLRRVVLATGTVALMCTTAGPAAADQQTVQLGFTNGNCGKTVIEAKAGTPVIFDVITSGNLTTGASLSIPDKGVQVALPDTAYWTITRIDLGVNQPGPLRFQVASPAWSGSAGRGCQGVIQFA